MMNVGQMDQFVLEAWIAVLEIVKSLLAISLENVFQGKVICIKFAEMIHTDGHII